MNIAVEQLRFRHEILIFLGILIIGALARFYALGQIPAGLNQDEASMGYDAYSLLHYGIDRNGTHNPVQMIAWGSGQNSLQAYVTMPFIALFDLSVFSIRLVPALFGVICLAVFYWLARRIAGRRLAAVALFVLAISPWHIVLSRWALESNFLPGVILAAVALLIKAQERPRLLYLSFGFFALSLYAYSTAYAFVPAFLILYGIYALHKRLYSLKDWLIACTTFTIIAIPIALFVFVNLFKLTTIDSGFFTAPRMPGEARYTHMTSFFSNEFLQELLKNFKRVVEILFIQFNDRETQSSVTDIGAIYAFSIPFVIVGLAVFIRDWWRESQPSARFPILLWLLLAFFVAILSWPAIHRMNLVFFPLILMAAYGVRFFWFKSNLVFAGIICVYAALFVRFEKVYFTDYAEEVGSFFFESYTDSVTYAYQYAAPKDTIYLSDNLNQPYIHVLFITKYDVRDYIATVDIPNRTDAFQTVKSFGRFVFGVQTPSAQKASVVVARNDEIWLFPVERYIVKHFKNYSVLFHRNWYGEDADGNPIWQSNSFNLADPTGAVDENPFRIIKPDPAVVVFRVTVKPFYSNDEFIEIPFSENNDELTFDSKYLADGISQLLVVGRRRDRSDDLASSFFIFKPSNKQELLDPNRLQGGQSFGSLEKNRAYEGSAFSYEGIEIPWGFGTHTDSHYRYELLYPMRSLLVTTAMSQASGNCGDGATFEVLADGKLLASVDLLPAQSRQIAVNLAGTKILEFNTRMKESTHCDHTNWIAPIFIRNVNK
jgi:4-amino-4-deoxy-L-arabinose transferase-like glycosyltransferase